MRQRTCIRNQKSVAEGSNSVNSDLQVHVHRVSKHHHLHLDISYSSLVLSRDLGSPLQEENDRLPRVTLSIGSTFVPLLA